MLDIEYLVYTQIINTQQINNKINDIQPFNTQIIDTQISDIDLLGIG